jgi:hypothetical protein
MAGQRRGARAAVNGRLRLGINQVAVPIEAQKRPPVVAPARDRVAARQSQLAEATVIVELKLLRTRLGRDAIDDSEYSRQLSTIRV